MEERVCGGMLRVTLTEVNFFLLYNCHVFLRIFFFSFFGKRLLGIFVKYFFFRKEFFLKSLSLVIDFCHFFLCCPH